MAFIKKVFLQNFKKFKNETFEFNDQLNILVGDNDSGKSTLLEAIDLGLNLQYRGQGFRGVFSPEFVNSEASKAYLQSNKSIDDLPVLRIDVYLDGIPEYRGLQNSEEADAEGISVVARFDRDYEEAYRNYCVGGEDLTAVPTAFYKIEWFDFSGRDLKHINRKVVGLHLDASRFHPTHGKNQYLSRILQLNLSKDEQKVLELETRRVKGSFAELESVQKINAAIDPENVITERELRLQPEISGYTSLIYDLQLALDEVSLNLIGKGEQSQVQLKLALYNRAAEAKVILIEEPENHLTHSNLNRLVHFIESKQADKQLFITTHNSFVVNKLRLDCLCLLGKRYARLSDIDDDITIRLKRLPGFDTLRLVLSGKAVLVEGPSDELILKKLCLKKQGMLPEDAGIDVIVVGNLGFDKFLQIASKLGLRVNMVRDNDGDYAANVLPLKEKYKEVENIKILSHCDDVVHSLEPAMIDCNSTDVDSLDKYAEIVLPPGTFARKYSMLESLTERKEFLLERFTGDGKGGVKVDAAMNIFETDEELNYPTYLSDALEFDE